MHTGLVHLHSALRYFVLLLLIAAIAKAFAGWFGKKEFTTGDDKIGLFLMIGAHIQLLIGLWLYFISPWVQFDDMKVTMGNEISRFWAVEHALGMLIAIALITIGRVRTKKATDSVVKHKRSAIAYLIALILIVASIPWPFRELLGRGWF